MVDAYRETAAIVVELADGEAVIEFPDRSRRRLSVPSEVDIRAGQEVGVIEFDDGSAPIFDWTRGRRGSGVTKIYVRLLDEAVDVWRPIRAAHQADDVYRIVSGAVEGEEWEFSTGALVRCRRETLADHGEELVAFEAL
jgi:hypothetical protein